MLSEPKTLTKLSILEFGEWSFSTDFGQPIITLAGTEFYKINKIFGLCFNFATDPKQVILVASAGSILTKDSLGNLSFLSETDFNSFKSNTVKEISNVLQPTLTSQEVNKNLEDSLKNSNLLGYNRKK